MSKVDSRSEGAIGPAPPWVLLHSGTGGGGREEGGLSGPPVCLCRQVQPGENMSPQGDMRRNALRPECIRHLERGMTDQTSYIDLFAKFAQLCKNAFPLFVHLSSAFISKQGMKQ